MTPRPCFVDTMRPITPAETEAWRFYLNLHRDAWRPARAMFRSLHAGATPSEVLLEFVAVTGLSNRAAERLEGVLQALAKEEHPSCPRGARRAESVANRPNSSDPVGDRCLP
jgi:hypothetical protein